MVSGMRSRISFFVALLLLATCLLCQIAEIFDQWDHTLQTGDDTEYTFVVLALCAGAAYALRWFVPAVAASVAERLDISFPRFRPMFSAFARPAPVVPISASPPFVVALRI